VSPFHDFERTPILHFDCVPNVDNLRSSKKRNSCFAARAFKPLTVSGPKSLTRLVWVLKMAIWNPRARYVNVINLQKSYRTSLTCHRRFPRGVAKQQMAMLPPRMPASLDPATISRRHVHRRLKTTTTPRHQRPLRSCLGYHSRRCSQSLLAVDDRKVRWEIANS
jgi:hypothetical protein